MLKGIASLLKSKAEETPITTGAIMKESSSPKSLPIELVRVATDYPGNRPTEYDVVVRIFIPMDSGSGSYVNLCKEHARELANQLTLLLDWLNEGD